MIIHYCNVTFDRNKHFKLNFNKKQSITNNGTAILMVPNCRERKISAKKHCRVGSLRQIPDMLRYGF